MDLYHLRTFVAAARAGHLTRAAERLYLSQPAASAHIKALEQELDLALFTRRSSGLELTSAGFKLLARAERLLLDADALVAEARQLTGQVTGRLRIGSTPDPELVRLGPLISRLVATHPLLEISVQQRNSLSSFEGVRNGELDACFALGSGVDSSLAVTELLDLCYVVTAPRAWQRQLQHWTLQEIAAAPWVLPPQGGAHDQMIGTLFRAQGLAPVPAVRVDNELMILNCIAGAVGLGLMREDIALRAQREGLVAVAMNHRIAIKLLFAHVAERSCDPVIAALSETIRGIWR